MGTRYCSAARMIAPRWTTVNGSGVTSRALPGNRPIAAMVSSISVGLRIRVTLSGAVVASVVVLEVVLSDGTLRNGDHL